MYEELKEQARAAAEEIIETAKLSKGQILVVGVRPAKCAETESAATPILR